MREATDAQLRLHRALTGGDTLGSYPDPVAARLNAAVKASYDVLAEKGLTAPPAVSGAAAGPYLPGGPDSLVEDCLEQVTARYRHDDQSRWRTMAEAAQQLAANLHTINAAAPPAPTTPTPPSAPASSWPNALWVGKLGTATRVGDDGSGTTYRNIQSQRLGGTIRNTGGPIEIVNDPLLGRALRMRLNPGDMRLEINTNTGAHSGWRAGMERWAGFDMVIEDGYPLAQTRDRWSICSQVHHAANTGSPPFEIDLHSGAMWIRGDSTGYNRKVCDVKTGVKYRVVFGLNVSNTKGGTIVNVLVNDEHLIRDYKPPISFGAPVYWKVSSAYVSGGIARPLATRQNNHRIGPTHASVR